MGLLGVLALAIGFVLLEGVGIWGNNVPVTWALDIVVLRLVDRHRQRRPASCPPS